MFTSDERNRVRERLLELAKVDRDIAGAAITGSHAVGGGDEWSDIDIALAIRGDLPTALEHWTDVLYRDFGALHHWDLPFASTVYRVFLLPGCLEVDIAFTPAADFGPRGPNWRHRLRRGGREYACFAQPKRSRWPRVASRAPRACVHRAREAVAGNT